MSGIARPETAATRPGGGIVAPVARVLTVAGSDSGGGAGIQADLKTMQALGVHGMSAVTAVTVQDSLGVKEVHQLPPALVRAQMEAVLADIGADAVKTGMLHSADTIRAVAEVLRDCPELPLVLDPVVAATSGAALLEPAALAELRRSLLPRVYVLTPNLPEACLLLGRAPGAIDSVDAMLDCAHALLQLGPRYVLLKGGHLAGAAARGQAVDVLVGGEEASGGHPAAVESAPAGSVKILAGDWWDTPHTHGTGCALAAALASYLALGRTVDDAARAAKSYVAAAIAASYPLGSGRGTLAHLPPIRPYRRPARASRALPSRGPDGAR
ncbi:bifunctional hydroxymethylpyrimidine kinase/phosphomethylpyrimidine kinase [Paenibacillus sp. IB182496]|uniref:Hydroxymethylpyrimidine/phosphomethylpyrimidine kinase n=1 Tax=Paenibacillus sabuli TaxID=2772509 RepID=A0A927GUY6_9BACL|nr:bifunctional hydroxymethylpyrimidine kinase/phosphomethylpyrimidine kinase [Paenibacillus sabuli]MBD2848192.1 bifunctional hydroxymethylpyrimidine kinase/phosphomethylpyrimidine kinase [Paenibacillus sabuli]